MTVIVGVRGKKGVLLAADAAATSPGWGDQRERRNGKAHLLSETVAFSCCGSPRVSQLIRFMDSPPAPELGDDEYRWAVKTFIPRLRTTLADGGALENDSGILHVSGHSCLLLAVRDRLFEVCSDLQVGESSYPWAVDGSGGEPAAGVFINELGDRLDPVDDEDMLPLAKRAVEAGIAINAYCAGKVSHVRTKKYSARERKIAAAVLETS